MLLLVKQSSDAEACVFCGCGSGEMAMPHYTGRVADWIMNKEAPEAFTNAITAMALLTVARLVHLTFI